VAVLSYDYWRTRFGADPGVIGRTITVNNHKLTIIGVSQAGFDGVDIGSAPSIRVPVLMKAQMTPNWDDVENRRSRWVNVFGRLEPGVTLAQAKAAMQPYFRQDGITLEYEAPTLWLAQGEPFRGLAVASLDRVVGQRIDAWMPREAQAGPLRRLQQEMQMLLYTHDVNEERVRGGLLPVNSFWVSGAGALPGNGTFAPPPDLQITHYLRDAALLEDWRGWAAAWQQVDSKECARLAKLLDAGGSVTLTLCGERRARSWSSSPRGGLMRRVGGWLSRNQAAALLETL